jgi:predicted nucleotidyltransferase
MKIERAVRYAMEVASRVHSVNGILSTPLCNREAVRIKRIWVFGSTVKGSKTPNDLDLLIDINECGRRRKWRQGKLDKEYLRRYGMRRAINAEKDPLKWLAKGMQKVSRHTIWDEAAEIDFKVLLYPRNDFMKLMVES